MHSDTKKVKNLWMKKKAKTTTQSYAYKGYTSTYSIEISNSFNPEQLKVNESAIKNKLIDLLTELEGFKSVTTFVLEFKKIESDGK